MRNVLTAGFGLSVSLSLLAGLPAHAQVPAEPVKADSKEVISKPAKPVEKVQPKAPEKLPVDLPSVIIRGEDETAAPLKGGTKVAPVDPRAPMSQLPSAPSAKAPGALELAIEKLDPNLAPQAEAMPTPRTDWTELQLGVGGLYELGLFHGREIAGAVTESQLGLDSALPWLRARVGLNATWNLARAGLDLRHYHEDIPGGERLTIQSMDLDGSWTRDDLQTEGALEFGHLLAPANTNNGLAQDEDTWTRAVVAGAVWKPQLHPDHVPELGASLGHRETDRRSDATVYLRAFDHWTITPRWSVEAGLGGGLYVGMPVLDPMARVSYRPDDPTEISFGLTSGSAMPGFEELYLSRRLSEGNGGLLPQRSEVIATLSGSHRLNDLWYATAELSYQKVSRFIYWEDADQDGLWRPVNAPLGAGQDVWGGDLSATYQIGAVGTQRFHYKLRSAAPMGLLTQEAGAVHQRTLIADKLTMEAGASILLDQLSAAQVNAPSSGWQILANAGLNYRLNDRIGLYAKVQDLPLAVRPPSFNYYAPFGLALIGATVEF